ncbi:MAG: flavin reductase [Peptostreptococcaceae bacterium]|nr:flavin reductase [Peptostreptococcaceae bacterium]
MYCGVDYSFYTEKFLRQLPKGVFLNTRNGSIANITTSRWGSIGIMWGKPVFAALIKPSRFTCGLIEKTGEFTVSVPVDRDFTDELLICGQTTGMTTDKFSECNLTAMKSQTLETFIVGDCRLHLDCKVLMKNEMKMEAFLEKSENEYCNRGDFYNLYYAEIVSAYVVE